MDQTSVAAPSVIMVRPCVAGDREDIPSESPAESVLRLRRALGPLLSLSRLVGLAPFCLEPSAKPRLRRSRPATAFSLVLLATHVALGVGHVSIVGRVRCSPINDSVASLLFLRTALEVAVGVGALMSAATASGRHARQALLASAERAATLLSYRAPHTRLLLLAQSGLVVALLPLYLYMSEEEFLGNTNAQRMRVFQLATLQLCVVQASRACAFVLNAVAAIQFYACAQLTAQLWRRFVDEMQRACDATRPGSIDAQTLQGIHVALVELTSQFSAAFGRQTALQIYHTKAVLVSVSFITTFNLLYRGPGQDEMLASIGSTFVWLMTPKIFMYALCVSRLLSITLPCTAIESSAAQCVNLTHKLIGCARAGPAARETSALLSMLAAQNVRLETSTGAALGASLWAGCVTHVLAYLLLMAQFNCELTRC